MTTAGAGRRSHRHARVTLGTGQRVGRASPRQVRDLVRHRQACRHRASRVGLDWPGEWELIEVELCEVGASLVRLRVPDRHGTFGDVVIGLDRPQDYQEPHPALGSVVGRVANRIAGARFHWEGGEVVLPANDGRHHLHGGSARRLFLRLILVPEAGSSSRVII